MTPNAISDKMHALRVQMAKVIEATDEGNLLRAQKLLQDMQRTNVSLLRLLEMQLSGVSGAPRAAMRRTGVANSRNHGVPVPEPIKSNR